MIKTLGNIILVLGVCLAAVGAAGFRPHEDRRTSPATQRWTESGAAPLFGVGLALLTLGGWMFRSGAATQKHDGTGVRPDPQTQVEALARRILQTVTALDENKGALSPLRLSAEVDALLRGDYFDLAEQREAYAAQVGFPAFVRVWDGIATAERLLARSWSMATDGYMNEAVEQLALARRHLELAISRLEGTA